MSFLLQLPTDLVSLVVSQWLKLKDVSILDRAFCSKSERPFCCVLRLVSYRSRWKTSLFISWLTRRELRTSELFISDTDVTEWIGYIVNFGNFVSSIHLRGLDTSSKLFEQLLVAIFLHGCNLRSVVCFRCTISEPVLDILRYSPNLEEFKLMRCTDAFGGEYSTSISATTVKTVVLDVLWDIHSANRAIQGCFAQSEVQRLYVQYLCDELSSRPTQNSFCLLQGCGESLRFLGFKHALYSYGFPENHYVREAVRLCPNILHLDISKCEELTDIDVNAIACALTALRTINVSFCHITDASLIALAEHRQDTLVGLFAGNCLNITGRGFNAVLMRCNQLHTLGLELVPRITSSLTPQLLGNICTLQTAWKRGNEINQLLPWFTQLQNMYLRLEEFEINRRGNVLALTGAGAPDLRKLVLSAPTFRCSDDGFSDRVYSTYSFGYRSCFTIREERDIVAMLHLQRPNLHIRFEDGDDWPSNLMNLPV